MAKANDLTKETTEGYRAPDSAGNPYLHSSSCWMAFHIGQYLNRTYRTTPRDVRPGRGYQIHANDMLFAIRMDTNNEVSRVR